MSKFSKLIQKQKEATVEKKYRFNLEAKTNANRQNLECVCGSKKSFKTCCDTIHKNIRLAKTPLDLMKSRYAAYVVSNIEYLKESHHSSTSSTVDFKEVLAWSKSVVWLGLEIVETNQKNEQEGFVTFNAYYLEDGVKQVISEKSRFLRENNHWVYVDGVWT